MKHIRHYCDGHEYRYQEIEEGDGEVHDNYGTLVATLETDTMFETVCVIDANRRTLHSIHSNKAEVQTFEDRARYAIQRYVVDAQS